MEPLKEQSKSPIAAFDLGNSNLVVVSGGTVIVDVPSILAISYEEGNFRVVEKWEDTKKVIGQSQILCIHLHENVYHYNSVEYLVSELVSEAKKQCPISVETKIGVGIPIDFTYGDRLCLREAFEKLGCNNVFLMESPFATAISQGLDVSDVRGKMIIDIGGAKTQIAVICMSGIVVEKCISIGGDSFSRVIQNGLQREYNIKISEQIAEKIKKNFGTAIPNMENAPSEYVVRGPHIITAEPIEIKLSSTEIAEWLNEPTISIENAVSDVLERTPPELFNDIVDGCIWLTGGGSLLHNLPELLEKKTKIKVKLVDDPFHSAARGVETAMNDLNKYQFIMKL